MPMIPTTIPQEFNSLGDTVVTTGIPTGEAFGSPTITQFVTPTGIASGEAFGAAPVLNVTVNAVGIPSSEAFGNAVITIFALPTGIPSAEAEGHPAVALVPYGAEFGSYFLMVTAVANGTARAIHDPIVVKANEIYTCSVGVRSADTPRPADVRMDWYRSDGTLARSDVSPSVTTHVADWQRIAVRETAPDGAATLILSVEYTGCLAGERHMLDGVLLEDSEFFGDYFDASFLPAADYLWTGTPGLSQSRFFPRRALKANRLTAVMPGEIPPGVDFSLDFVDDPTDEPLVVTVSGIASTEHFGVPTVV